jgi:hypothetical protein
VSLSVSPLVTYLTEIAAQGTGGLVFNNIPWGESNGWFGPNFVAELEFIKRVACDFDDNLTCDIVDVDMLVNEIVASTNDPAFDLSADGAVNNADLSQWLGDAATENGFNAPYLLGDANLDGTVDSADLNNLALSWRHDIALWSAGDFTANGYIDSADLNSVALNWRESIPSATLQTAAIPEPSTAAMATLALAAVACLRRRTLGT